MIFRKKKEEKPEPKKAEHPLKKRFMDKSLANSNGIIAKIEEKRRQLFEMGRVKEGNEDIVNQKMDRMVAYMTGIDWDEIIDNTLSNACMQDIDGNFTKRVDEETARFLIQLTWNSVRDDINSMIEELLTLVYSKE